MRYVYLTIGEYEGNTHVAGVFDSVEAAKEAHPITDELQVRNRALCEKYNAIYRLTDPITAMVWVLYDDEWHNGGHHDLGITIERWEVGASQLVEGGVDDLG
jgi:hypothetical protein